MLAWHMKKQRCCTTTEAIDPDRRTIRFSWTNMDNSQGVIETKKKTQNGLQSQCLAPQWRHPCRMSYPELEVGEASCKAYGPSGVLN